MKSLKDCKTQALMVAASTGINQAVIKLGAGFGITSAKKYKGVPLFTAKRVGKNGILYNHEGKEVARVEPRKKPEAKTTKTETKKDSPKAKEVS